MGDALRAITLAVDSIGALAVVTARWDERTSWVDETNAPHALLVPLERALWQLEHLERTAQHIAALRDEAARPARSTSRPSSARAPSSSCSSEMVWRRRSPVSERSRPSRRGCC
ncbi:MAG: hypothetical protein ABTQ32_30015 [Myxococcaceae bacterium]